MRRVLLFGAAGFLGRHVLSGLAAAPGPLEIVAVAGRRARPGQLALDLAAASPADLSHLIASVRPDAVVNCAGATGGGPADLVRANVLAVANLIEALERAAPGARLVHLGSAAEYGPGEAPLPVAEDAPARPEGPYGATKLAATLLVQRAAQAGRLDGVVLRVFNPVGAGQPPSTVLGRAAAAFARAHLLGERPVERGVEFGPLDAYRDFVDARDVAAAVLAAVGGPDLAGRVLNVARGRAVLTRNLVLDLAAVAGYRGEVRERPAGGSARSADVAWQRADVHAASLFLGWAPVHDLRSSLEFLWRDAAENAARPAAA